MSAVSVKSGRHVGTVLMVFAAVHAGVSGVLFSDWLLVILQGGIGNLTWTAETLAAFWFLIFSWPVWVLGYVVNWAYRNTGRLPPFLGAWIFIVPALSLVFLPASGLWLFAIFGAVVLVNEAARRAA
ncbi:hypothetical protein BH23DEI1_BH23DEI1_16650 [soil metagenome]